MKLKTPLGIGAFIGGGVLVSAAVMLLNAHFAALKDVREFALPLAAELPALERRAALLGHQMELSALESSMRTDSAREKLDAYVLPQGEDVTRLLAFLESTRTFLERKKLLKAMSPVVVGDPQDATISADGESRKLKSRSVTLTMTVKPEGRAKLFSILDLSGLLTVGDALSSEDVKALFALTETQNYAGIVPVEQFLSADLQKYVEDPTLPEARLEQAMPDAEFLAAFRKLLDNSRLAEARELLGSDLGRMLTAQKLWPVQFMTVEKESLEEMEDGWERVELTVNAYSR